MRVFNSQKGLTLLNGESATRKQETAETLAPRADSPVEALGRLREIVRAAEDLVLQVGASSEAARALSASESAATEIQSLAQSLQALVASVGVDLRQHAGAQNGSFRLYGPIQKLSPVEVFEFTRTSRKTGCVTVEDGDFTGIVSILDGEVIHAEAGDQLGFDAFCEILQATEGKVEFHSVPVSPEERNIHYSTLELVFRALQCLDERSCELRR